VILFVSTTAAGGGSTGWNKQLLPFAVRLASMPATAFNKGAEIKALTVCIAKTKDEMQFEHNRMHGRCCSRGQKAACQFLCDNLHASLKTKHTAAIAVPRTGNASRILMQQVGTVLSECCQSEDPEFACCDGVDTSKGRCIVTGAAVFLRPWI